MQLPFGFGHVDAQDWVRGLVAAFIQGGSAAVVSGVVVSQNDPKEYALGSGKFFGLVTSVFLVAGTLGAFAFLRQKPLPDLITTTVTAKTTEQPGTEPKTETTVQTTTTAPAGPTVIP